MQDVSNIPDGNGSALVLEYSYPLNEPSSGATIPSTFPDQLGTDAIDDTLIFDEYAALETAKLSVTGVSYAADGFEATIGAFESGFQAASDGVQ